MHWKILTTSQPGKKSEFKETQFQEESAVGPQHPLSDLVAIEATAFWGPEMFRQEQDLIAYQVPSGKIIKTVENSDLCIICH